MNKTLAHLALAVIGAIAAGTAFAQSSGKAGDDAHSHAASPVTSTARPANTAKRHLMPAHMQQMHEHMMSMHAQMAPHGSMDQAGSMPCIEDAKTQ